MNLYANNIGTIPCDPSGTITYDELNRKTGETINYGTFSKNYSYSYDHRGNKSTYTDAEGIQHNYQYQKNDHLSQISFDGQAIDLVYDKTRLQQLNYPNGTSTAYSYNENGWLTGIQTQKDATILLQCDYQFDPVGNIEQQNTQVGATLYSYDPFGRRIKKQVGNVVTLYLYSDEGLIGEYSSSGSWQKSYGWRPNSLWGTNPLYMRDNTGLYYYHNDHLGTPQRLTNATTGEIAWSAGYQAFGKATVDPLSTVENNLRFPGQYYDQETKLHYNWNRTYDPGTGRYTQVDPIGFEGGINLFAYTESNPITFIDSEGLAYFSYRPLGGIGGIGGIFGVVGNRNDDRLNTVVGHEQLFFQDGKNDPNVGFFDNGTVKTEPNPKGYEPSHDSGWNDCVMREAVKRVPKHRYKLLWEHGTNYKYNCQDWADEVRRTYRKLIQDSAIIQRCKPSCSEMNK